MQTALSDHMSSHTSLGDDLGSAATLVKITKDLVPLLNVPEDCLATLQRARVQGKRAVGVNFAIKEIVHKVPSSPDQIPVHAAAVLSKLASRGIAPGKVELPGFLSRVLLKMKEVKAPAAPQPAPADKAEASAAAA